MIHPELVEISKHLGSLGAKCYLVGGAVRDLSLGLTPKDLDIEVFGMTSDKLAQALRPFGRVQEDIGKSFSVIILKTKSNDFDFALPRRELKVGRGYKGFEVEIDPFMSPEEAASRRDFTFNALMYDIEENQVLDFYGGQEDLDNRILKHVGPAFAEDPLRVLRGFQFAGRFNMEVDPETAVMCNSLLREYDTFPTERIWGEWMKWATKSVVPSKGLKFLVDTGWIEAYPEIQAMMGVQQEYEWHPEGDVFIHTGHVVDAAMNIARRENITGYDRVLLLMSALCHDFGKAECTVFERERWRSPNHGSIGIPAALTFLEAIGVPQKIVAEVPPLMAEHLNYLNVGTCASIRKLSYRLKPSTIRQLALLIEADHSGRPPKPKMLPPEARAMLVLAEHEKVLDGPPRPLVTGKLLISSGLVKPGPKMGEILADAYTAQLNCKINDNEDAIDWVKDRFYVPIITGQLLLDEGLIAPSPAMGHLLKAAQRAQEAGEFNNLAGGLGWVKDYLRS